MAPTTKCFPFYGETLGNTISGLLLDAMLLVLPLFAIAQLHMPIERKLACSAIFFLGILFVEAF